MARLLILACALAASLAAHARTDVAPMADADYAPRLIVKFRSASAESPAARVAKLALETGVPLAHGRTMGIGAQVLTSPAIRSQADADAMAALLARHPDVAYAERSRRVHAERMPNDPLFPQQFYLGTGTATIDAVSAWDVTLGSPAIVVAVLDTGSTSHADLAGRLLPGYDFVADLTLSNDGSPLNAQGNYRDADASDPGDWVALEDLSGPLGMTDCSVRASSWHGTSVMGTIAANADNGAYLSGVDWNARILPVRVLGKCYGDDPDTADAIMWAAGLPVPGAPVNTTPAQVINLSLGDPGACPQFMQDAVDAALAHGITRAIVASAGNQNSGGSHFPSSCLGVISVGATTSTGGKASYSNFGPDVDIAAPGGNSGGGAGSFVTLYNSGLTVPIADVTTTRSGTSFSAPLVSGVASLMLSVAPGLSATALRDLITQTAKPFPSGSNCPTLLCGAGIVDASNAVRRAQATTGGTVPVTMVEYYNAALDHYFMTWVGNEIVLLDAGTTIKGWRRTGKTFVVLRSPAAGTSAVCRIYIPPGSGDGHFFGRDAAECAGTLAQHPNFISEDPAFFHLYPPSAGTCAAGLVPVYRVFSNRADANHRYTTERAVRDEMAAKGWLVEGDGADAVVMCAPA